MTSSESTPRTLKDLGISESKHPAWLNAFPKELQSEQLQEDHSAWYGVTGLLLTIIIGGVSLAVFAVSLCLAN